MHKASNLTLNDLLPEEILIRIFRFLDSPTQQRLHYVCRLWKQILQSQAVISQVMVSIVADKDSRSRVQSTGCGHYNCTTTARCLSRLIQPGTKSLIIAHKDASKTLSTTKSFQSAYKLCQLTCQNTFSGNFPHRLSCLKTVVMDGISVHFTGLLHVLPKLPASLRHFTLRNVVLDHFAFLPDNRSEYRGKIIRNGKPMSGIWLYTMEVVQAQIKLPVKDLTEAKTKIWTAIECENAMKPLSNAEIQQLETLAADGISSNMNQHFREILQRLEATFVIFDVVSFVKENLKNLPTVVLRELHTAACL